MDEPTRWYAERALRWTAPVLLLGLLSCGATRPVPAVGPRLTEGVAIGEVTPSAAILWGRCDRAATLHALLANGVTASAAVTEDGDFIGTMRLDGLPANQVIDYVAWCGAEGDPPLDPARVVTGSFATAPRAEDVTPIRLVWGGDVGGQNACRDAREGYAILDRIRDRQPSFFVALGDMIYADSACAPIGLFGNAQIEGPPASSAEVESFRRHWRYNRADAAFQRLLHATSMYSVWDDHEITDDAGPLHDQAKYAPGVSRLLPARIAFVENQPLARGEKPYRSFRWGRHVELFLLDTRSYRDANFAADTGAAPKSMLGAAQRAWLAESVSRSDATWKIVVSSVPLSIPTGNPTRGYDGWANYDGEKGFERELLALLRTWREAGVVNLVFITTDVHFATGFRYRPFPNFSFLELVSGPLNAGMFPKQDVDATLQPERLFFYAPPAPAEIRGIDAARHYFNFGELDVGPDGVLQVRIINGDGEIVYEGDFPP